MDVIDAAYRRGVEAGRDSTHWMANEEGYRRGIEDAARVAQLWRGLKGPSVAEKIRALAPPQEGSP